MIFVGHGALLWRAVRHARDRGHTIDLVCTEPGALPADPGVAADRVRQTADVNELAAELGAACTDGVVWSIDNRFIFREPVLGLGLPPEQAREAVRFSLGTATTADEIVEVLRALPAIVGRARQHR